MTSKSLYGIRALVAKTAVYLVGAAALPGSTLFVGFNTVTPVQLYDTSGNYLQDFGPAGAIVAFPDGSGDYYSITPSPASSAVTEYNSSFSAIGGFTVNNLITDGGSDAGSLLFSSYNGSIYRVSTAGAVLDSWSTGYTHVGVTSNGTDIFTTEGDGGNRIDVWSTSGASLGHIAAPFVGLYGLGYDSSTGNFWAGSTNFVYELSAKGSLLASLNITGDSRTPNGAVHDGLEVGNLVTPPPPIATPEPSTAFLIFGGGLLGLVVCKSVRLRKRVPQLAVFALGLAAACFGSVTVTLTPSVPSGAPVGTTITWTATAADTTGLGAAFTYQFGVAPAGAAMQVRQDFYSYNTFPWTPADSEGVYSIQVIARSSTGDTGIANASFAVTSLATGGVPVISPTKHPLVALYSTPPCAAGSVASVRFKLPTDSFWQSTSSKACDGSTSMNFYIVGMRASSTYQMQQDIFNGPFDTPGPVLGFTTGATPSDLPIAPYSVVGAPSAPNNTAYPVLLLSPVGLIPNGEPGAIPYATDSAGQLIWYLPPQPVDVSYLTRPSPGGTFFVITADGSPGRLDSLLSEYDAAGNLIRETNYSAISQQLMARGTDPITSIHHETIQLPNGGLAFIGSSERVADQGAGPVDVLGDQVIVVDSNMQVIWSWNEFDHLDVTRAAILGETCIKNGAGCPPIDMPGYTVANDWTHSNALALTSDGNMLVSSRHQDWVMKVRYASGTGDGALLWKLGKDGDFQVSSADPYPWFSHQHDIELDANGQLSLFDNGNTRIAQFGGNSRGQAWQVDEVNMVATPALNLDLGDFSLATGTTQLLSNGNYAFDLGATIGGTTTKMKEFTPANVLQAEQDSSKPSYRSFRMRSLYSEY